jgi:hypothetical protein
MDAENIDMCAHHLDPINSRPSSPIMFLVTVTDRYHDRDRVNSDAVNNRCDRVS